ncbi:endonuclease/exonuclease/phosphatase family protein [Georgenia alba]|uniref:Endonuclease/exonuclease/phosphatase family protein n=1 Tax=Georgenia alba TaxID=2233858 RepID=A0ABW2QCY3_9MICO
MHELGGSDVRERARQGVDVADGLRVLTLNLQHGLPAATAPDAGSRASRATLRRAAEEVARTEADVVLLQEVDRYHPRSGNLDQAGELARELGMSHRFAAALAVAPGGLLLPARRSTVRRGYGVALLSRVPVRSWHVRRLRGSGLRRMPGPWWAASGWWPDEDRVLLAGVLSTPGGPLTVGVAHLSVLNGVARRQLATCVDALRALPGPQLLGGDLNLGPQAVAAVTAPAGFAPLASGLTFTNAHPRKQIDHLLGCGVRAGGPGRVHHLSVSDHAGIGVALA